MASAPPVEQHDPATTAPLPVRRRARTIALCGLLAVIAVVAGLIAGSGRHDSAPATATVISDSPIVATALPYAPTPTPLANKPPPSPTTIPPTNPPVVAAPAAQPIPVQTSPIPPRTNGKGNGNGKGSDKGKGND